MNSYKTSYPVAEALCYSRRADKVRAHWRASVQCAKPAEVSEFTRSKSGIEVMEIIMRHYGKDHMLS